MDELQWTAVRGGETQAYSGKQVDGAECIPTRKRGRRQSLRMEGIESQRNREDAGDDVADPGRERERTAEATVDRQQQEQHAEDRMLFMPRLADCDSRMRFPISPGGPCSSECANRHTGSDRRVLVLPCLLPTCSVSRATCYFVPSLPPALQAFGGRNRLSTVPDAVPGRNAQRRFGRIPAASEGATKQGLGAATGLKRPTPSQSLSTKDFRRRRRSARSRRCRLPRA